MAIIKKITDKQGNNIYLRTHTKAVIDDNGYTAESRLQAMQDEINSAQLEIGAVQSDLTPTEGSTNWVTSGGVYNSMLLDSGYTEVLQKTPSLSKVVSFEDNIVAGEKYRITITNVGSGSKGTISIGNTSSATEITSINNTTFTEGMTTTFIPTVNATHWRLYVTTAQSTITIEKYYTVTVKDMLSDIDETPTSDSTKLVTSGGVYNQMFFGNANAGIDLTQYVERRAWINNKKWSVATSYGIFIPVRPLQKYRIVGNSTKTSAYAFLFNDTTPSASANVTTFAYPCDDSIYINNGDAVIDTAPGDAVFMWVGTSDTAGSMDRAPQLVEEYNKESIIDSLTELSDSTSVIDARVEELENGLRRNQIQNVGNWQTSNASASPIVIEEDGSVIISCGSTGRIGFEISNIGDGEELHVAFHFEKSTTKTGGFGIGNTMTSTWETLVPVTGSATITPALKGDVEFSFIVPSGTQYLYLSAANFNGDTVTISDLKVWTEQTLTEKFDSLDATQRIPPTYTQYEYYGAKINIPSANHLAHEKYMNLNCSRMSSNYYQGAACYGNYLFIGGENGYELDIYNLATQSFVEHIEISGKTSNSNDHMNTLFFSNEFYDTGDEFPVLYSCSGKAAGSNNVSYVHGYRLAQSNGAFTATLVHTITLDYGTWTEAVCDTEHGYLWVKHEESRTDENKMGWFKYAMPKATNGDVTLTMDANVIDSFNLPPQDYGTASMQGFLYYEGNIYYTAGNGAQAGGLHLVSINTKTKCRETDINLAAIGLTQEPEFCIVYDKHLFVGYTSKLVKFYFD